MLTTNTIVHLLLCLNIYFNQDLKTCNVFSQGGEETVGKAFTDDTREAGQVKTLNVTRLQANEKQNSKSAASRGNGEGSDDKHNVNVVERVS